MGHDVGDLLLQQVAHRLTTSVREGDTVARQGGDEFVVILEGLSSSPTEAATQAQEVGEKILTALNQPYRLGTIDHTSTASIGATLFGSAAKSIDELLKQADLAMYKAKETGRNSLRFFDPTMQNAVQEPAAPGVARL
jgi:diguanylate cyclase (GGDEF)-like protein